MTIPEEVEELKNPQEILPLLPHEYQHLLSPYRIFAIRKKNQIAGFALYSASDQIAEAPFIFITPEYQTNSIGNALLSTLENQARSEKKLGLTIGYKQDPLFEPYLEKLMKERGYSEPENWKLLCHFHLPTFDAPWMHYRYKLPPGYSIAPWSTVTKEEITAIEKERLVHPSLLPIYEPEPINSLVLRFQDKLIGWMLTHRSNDDEIRYHAFFTRSEHRLFGPSVKMLTDSIRLHKASSVIWGLAEINYMTVDSTWLHFVLDRLVPYTSSTTRYYRSFWRC